MTRTAAQLARDPVKYPHGMTERAMRAAFMAQLRETPEMRGEFEEFARIVRGEASGD